jgi:serine/threonine protein phosphatase PrpC
MRLRGAACTHRGHVRAINEDTIIVGSWLSHARAGRPLSIECELHPDEPFLLLVADGLGGHAAGDRASQFAADMLTTRARHLTGIAQIADEIIAVSKSLHELSRNDRQFAGMGTTVTGLSLVGNEAFAFNVGDSSLFLYEYGALVQLSTPDEFPTRPGEPASSLITQSLGPQGERLEPHVDHVVLPTPGSAATFVLCSDGVTDLVSLDTLEDLLAAAIGHPRRAVEKILAGSLSAGGYDNISIIVADVISDHLPDSVEGEPQTESVAGQLQSAPIPKETSR